LVDLLKKETKEKEKSTEEKPSEEKPSEEKSTEEKPLEDTKKRIFVTDLSVDKDKEMFQM